MRYRMHTYAYVDIYLRSVICMLEKNISNWTTFWEAVNFAYHTPIYEFEHRSYFPPLFRNSLVCSTCLALN